MTQRFTLTTLLILALGLANVQTALGQCAFLNKQENGNTYYPRTTNQTVGIGNAAFLRFGILTGGNTAYHWDVCGFTGYDTQMGVYNGSTNVAYNDDFCAGVGGNNYSSSIDWTSTYAGTANVQLNRYSCQDWGAGFGSATLNYRCVAPTGLAVGTAGNGTWNIFCYDAGDAAGGSGAWSSNYSGYYTDNTLNFNTTTRWTNSPYEANATGGNAYVGCYIMPDNHSWRAIRTNIACGAYQLQVTHDDIGQIYINGTNVYNNAACCASTNAGTFVIVPSDVVEYRVSEGGGGSNGLITFNAGAALNGGTISYAGATAACVSYDPPAFGNSAAASAGSSAAVTYGTSTYQWQVNGADIGSATALTYDAPTISTPGTYVYRRKVTDRCGTVAYSSTVTITITAQSVIPTLGAKTPNVTDICQGQGVSATINAGSGGGPGAADTYEYSTNGGGAWSAYTSGTNITTATATTSVQIRVSRSAGTGTGCGAVGPTVIASWNVTPQAVAPTLNVKTPNVAAICQGQAVNATITAGSGGGPGAADTYQYSTDGGSTWSAYTSGTSINTASATTSVQVRVSRSAGSGTGCNAVGPNVIATWTVSPQAIAPTLNAKTPNVTDICQGQAVSATINAGSGGSAGATDTYEYSINGGGVWSAYTSGSNITTSSATGSVQIRVTRSGGSGTGCNTAGPNVIATWNVSVQPIAPTLNVKTPNVTDICQGQAVSATITAGSGGSTGATDTYQYSTDGGSTWSAYTSGTSINTASATTSVQVRVSRSGGSGTGCNTVGPNVIATWNVSVQPVAPTLNVKTPNVAAICQGQAVSATITAGSGGSAGAADTYQYSTDGGSTWSTYTSGNSITTTTATISVQVRVSRSGGSGTGCNAVGPNVIATWTVTPQAIAPTLNAKTPNVTDICQGQTVSATINAGSGGGAGATDTYEFSTNGGGTWSTYTSGSSISTATATGSVQVRTSRSGGSGTGCNTAGPNVIASWNVSVQPIAPTLNVKTPNVTDICQGQAVSATITAGSGGSTGATDTYEVSTNGGSTWSTYTSGASINTASATTSVQVRVSRSGGSGTGCNAVGPNVIATWNVTPQAVAPTLNVKTPNVAAICQGQAVNATITAGSGGGAGAADSYEVSTNGGSTWSAYTSGSSINTASATTSVQVRVSRSAGSGTGCNAVGPNVIATWTVSPQAIAPTLNVKTPNVTDICQGQAVNATITAGSGGGAGAADSYEVSTNGGGTWSAYTSGASINTTSATTSVQVRVSRSAGSGTGCNAVGPNVIATWNVTPQAVAPTLNVKTPNTASICQGDPVSASINAGSGGGTGAADTYEYSTDGGSSWLAYIPGVPIVTTLATTSVQVRVGRSAGSGTGCNAAGPNVIATWNINANPSAFIPSILTTTPLCMGGNAQLQVTGSQAGITYQLRDNTTNVGSSQAGTGGTLTFLTNNLTSSSSTYNVLASTGSSCTLSVAVPTVSVTPTPSGLAMNSDVRTCYVNGNNGYVEFISANGSIMAINPGAQNLGYVTVTEYVNGSPLGIQACNTSPTSQPQFNTATLGRHWTISSTVAPSANLNVRLYFGDVDLNALKLASLSNANGFDDIGSIADLELSKYSGSNENATFTDNCGTGTVTLHLQNSNGVMNPGNVGYMVPAASYSVHTISSFSELWLSGTNNVSPLPIELTSFTATCQSGMVELGWTTATEINNEKFIIERSANLQAWEEVAVLPGAGNSNAPLSYATVDTRPLQGLSYYRLTQKDYDGASETFAPVSITCYSDGSGNSLMVYPNPTAGEYTVSVFTTEAGSGQLEITDMNGKRISIQNVNLTEGTNTFVMDGTMLNPGPYVIYVRVPNMELRPIKLIKQ